MVVLLELPPQPVRTSLFLEGHRGITLTAALLAAALLGVAVALVTRLASRLLRTRLREALDPENLRVA